MRTARHLSVSIAATALARRGPCSNPQAFGRALAAALALCAASACLSSSAPRGPANTRDSATPDAKPLARSSDNPRPVAWRYEAPAGCPSQERFRQEITTRTPALGTPRAADEKPAVHVAIRELSAGSWQGEVWLEHAGARLRRDVTGADCDEVVVALALIASLWLPRAGDLDLTAVSGSAQPASVPAPSGGQQSDAATSERSDADVDVDADADADALASAASLSGAPVEAPPPIDDTAREPAGAPFDVAGPSSPSRRSRGDARLHLVGLLGYASEPGHAYRGGLRAELWGSDSPSSWAAVVGAAYTAGRHQSDRFGTITLRAVHAQLDLCPPGLALGRAWLRACVFGRGGGLHFSAADANLDASRSLWRPWAALGPSLHGGLAVTRAVSLRAATEMAVNVVRDEFATERSSSGSEPTQAGGSTLYDTALLAFDLSLGVAYVF